MARTLRVRVEVFLVGLSNPKDQPCIFRIFQSAKPLDVDGQYRMRCPTLLAFVPGRFRPRVPEIGFHRSVQAHLPAPCLFRQGVEGGAKQAARMLPRSRGEEYQASYSGVCFVRRARGAHAFRLSVDGNSALRLSDASSMVHSLGSMAPMN